MRTVVIGGTGHIGSYLVPRLMQLGDEVIVVSRGERTPYGRASLWDGPRFVAIDREGAEKRGEFGAAIAELEPDVVVDLICFTQKSGEALVSALKDRISHFLSCGTIWVHGHSEEVPTTEDAPRRPFGEYGIAKAALERYLLDEARRNGFPATVIHPGHIVGRGWSPLNPEGHFDLEVWDRIAAGRELTLPNLGLETVHHVHADDVASLIIAAINQWSAAVGESFHAVSPKALTLRGYAEAAYSWYHREPRLRFVPWETLRGEISETQARYIWDHIAHSPCCSIEKARSRLGWTPRYTSLEAIRESVLER